MRTKIIIAGLLIAGSMQAQKSLNMLVGTYTNGTSKGIYSFKFNQQTGKAVLLDSLEIRNPSYLIISKNRKSIYAVSEMNDQTASINSIQFNQTNGQMRLVNSLPTEGEDPCYVESNGNIVLTANYSGGSMSAYSLRNDGSIGSMTGQYLGAIGGPDLSRQETPHIHCARFTPDGQYILATDFSADRIRSFRLRGNTIVANGIAADMMKDSGPRHLVFSGNGRFAYLMSELSGRVTAFKYHDGRLKEIQSVVSDSVNARGGADIHISPDGRFLYSSNRLKADGIAIFSINPQTGLLTKVGYQPTAIHPRHFNITPNGRYLLCACRDSNVIQVFLRDAKTGLLTDTHQDIPVDKAVCVQFCE